jgi:hypothetical protein
MSEPIEFNINNYVSVKLNERGEKIYKEHWAQYDFAAPVLIKDADGLVRFQMWDLMRIFGSHISMGRGVPFETTIYLIP